jgi:hypothetical protein
MFIPHQPDPINAVRYFLSFEAEWTLGAEASVAAAADVAMKERRFSDIGIGSHKKSDRPAV